LYVYSIVLFSLGYFDFSLYTDFLLKSSKGILGLLGYDAVMEPSLLIGKNGTIFIENGCMGFKTMFLFAALVYLTGNKHKRGWDHIIFGLLILNFLNILRIVLLFIHIQKHGDYVLATDHHELYKYIFYFIVFVLWVIWFERLMDLKTIKSIRSFLKR
jgi:exosortase/archaeosortase family protein